MVLPAQALLALKSLVLKEPLSLTYLFLPMFVACVVSGGRDHAA